MKKMLTIFILLLSFFIEAQKSDFKHINFNKADSIANSYKGSSLKNLPVLVYKLTNNLDTQVEKFRSIHTWVCSNITSDHSFGETTLKKRKKYKNDSISFSKWNNQVLSKMFQKLLKEKKTICSGYAYLIKELTTLANITCKIVDGYSRTTSRNVGEIDFPNHSWNAVKLNGKWYLVDATMASGYFNINTYKFVQDYNEGYFLASPNLFNKKNYPLNSKWLLSENKPTINQFVKAPIVYGSAFKNAIIPLTPEKLKTKIRVDETIVFKFEILDESKIKDMRLTISSGFSSKTIQANLFNCKNRILKLKNQFSKKGNYIVHFMVDKDIVFSYSIKVEKSKYKSL
ncbi:transglutaminase domain-containing protein [uncultured Algibacter sp.]|uniref:transglutaminase domain-containing protein n=1 Tax=uncultured Algibacter sp. TaxID=298659 RepID=UPI00263759EA|nr:transglutaminase domain-containing protein [uncultured Algibacter sp.]